MVHRLRLRETRIELNQVKACEAEAGRQDKSTTFARRKASDQITTSIRRSDPVWMRLSKISTQYRLCVHVPNRTFAKSCFGSNNSSGFLLFCRDKITLLFLEPIAFVEDEYCKRRKGERYSDHGEKGERMTLAR